MSRRSAFGWMELALGLILAALGVWIFIEPVQAAMGIADIILYVKVEKYSGFGPVMALAAGILSVMSGVMLAAYDRGMSAALTVLFPIWFVAHSASRLASLRSMKPVFGRKRLYCVMLINAAGLIAGAFMAFYPAPAALLGRLAGAYHIFLSADSILVGLSPLGGRRY